MKQKFQGKISTALATACGLALCILQAGCSTSSAIEPFPASLTYGGRSPIVDARVGSSFRYEVRDTFGDRYSELYEVQPDHTVRLVTRFKYSRP